MESKRTIVAIFDSLRKTSDGSFSKQLYHNNAETIYLGTFFSEPIYDLYYGNAHQSFLKESGNTSIKFELYEVDNKTLNRLDVYNGAYEEDFYDPTYSPDFERKTINTSYGIAHTYFYKYSVIHKVKIHNGDFLKYREDTKKLVKENNEINSRHPE